MFKKNNIFFAFGEKRKRVVAAAAMCAVAMSCFVSGCNFSDKEITAKETEDEPGKLSVVTTIFPQYDFARQISGGNADLTMLLGPGEESHTYEPTPQDIIEIQNADIFIYVGGESEAWVDDILSAFDTSDMEIINMMELVDVVEEEIVEGMENEEKNESNSEEKEYDEHVWTSIDNAQIISQAIADALCEKDEPNSSTYRVNCEKYLSELSELKKKFNGIVRSAERNTVVFGDRFPLRYFADEFGLEYYAAFPGCSEQSEPSAGTVAFLIEKVREEEIPVVFYLELSNAKIAKTIAESTEAETLCINSCHNVTLEQFLNGVTYIDLMNSNAEALEKALN